MEVGEEELVKRAKDGDETAFGFLVDRYKGAVHALAYRKLGDYHEAEDVVQEVFIRAYQKLNTLREPGNFAGWLYVITANCCRMHLRGRYRKTARTIPLDQVSEKQWNSISLRRHIDEERRRLVRDALAELPEGDRTVITLHYMGGMSCKEIARFMGTSVGAIKDRLYRARKKLKKEMIEMMRVEFAEHKLEADFTINLIQTLQNLKPSASSPILNRIIPPALATMAVVLTIGLGLFWNFAPQIDMGPFKHELTGEKGIRVSFIPNPPKETDTSISPIRNSSPVRVLIREIRIPVMVTSPAPGSQRSSARDIRGHGGSNITLTAGSPQSITITGRVLKDGDPVRNAEIYLIGEKAKAAKLICKSGRDGSFRFEIPTLKGKQGEITLLARHPLHSMGWKRISIDGELKEITIELFEPARVSGTVTDKLGDPVQGATVRIYRLSAPNLKPIGGPIPGFTVRTDGKGRFTLTGLPKGSRIDRLDVIGRGYAGKFLFDVQAGTEGIPITLQREGRIEGRVTYADTGKPAPGVIVYAQGIFPNSGWGETKTDSRGRYAITNLPSGLYNVFIEDLPDWTAVAREKVKVKEGKTVRKVDLKLVKGGFITGRVMDYDTGEPIPNCDVGFYDAARPESQAAMHYATTDENGYYRFRAAPGRAKVYIYTTPKGYIHGDQTRYVNVREGEIVSGVDFRLRKGAEIRGVVVTTDGKPVSGAEIREAPPIRPWIWAKSDERGRFTIRGIDPDRELSLEAIQRDQKLRGSADVIPGGGTKKRVIEVRITAKRYETTSVSGEVLDANGKPVSGATIWLTRFRGCSGLGSTAGVTDGSGRFIIHGLIVGDRYQISVQVGKVPPSGAGTFVARPNMPPQKIVLRAAHRERRF